MQFYTRPHLLALIQGANGSDTRTPRGSHIKHTRNPEPAPVDTDSFLRMFHAYTLDYYRFQSRRASPGGNVTVLTAGELSSQQIVTDEDGRPGILKTDCLGQRHLYSSAYIRSSDNVFSNIPVRKNLRLWLVMDDFAKEDKLKKWWEAAENRQSALEIQVHLVRSFNELYGRIRPHAAAAVTTRQILEWPLVAYNDTVSSILTGFSSATPSGGPPTEETGPGQTRSLLNEKVEFDQLRRMAWACSGLKVLWTPRMDFLPFFEYTAKVVRVIPSDIDPADLALERKKVVIPRWEVETIRVPLDCDWERLIEHLNALFPVDDDVCGGFESHAQEGLLDNAVTVPKAQLAPLLPKLKNLQKRVLRNAPGWSYSILTSSEGDDKIFYGRYVECKNNKDYAKMMAIVGARRQLVLARGTTISCLRLTTRMADVNNCVLAISNEGADGD